MNAQFAGVWFVVAASLVSALSYRHGGRRYSQGKSSAIPCLPGFRAVYRWVQLSTAVLGIAAFQSDAPWLLKIQVAPAQTYAGLAVAVLGVALFVWAKQTLGRHYSPCFDSFVPSGLVTSGPYAFVRHPMYAGALLIFLGIPLLLGSPLGLLAVPLFTGLLALRTVWEEEVLRAGLPGYAAYAARVRHRFVPGLW